MLRVQTLILRNFSRIPRYFSTAKPVLIPVNVALQCRVERGSVWQY
jgi:hypothetical protein